MNFFHIIENHIWPKVSVCFLVCKDFLDLRRATTRLDINKWGWWICNYGLQYNIFLGIVKIGQHVEILKNIKSSNSHTFLINFHIQCFYPKSKSHGGGGSWNLSFLISILYRCYIPNLVNIGQVLSEKL